MIGTISHWHFQAPINTDITKLTKQKSSTCGSGSCLLALQLLPIAMPRIRLGTRPNAHCVLCSILVDEWSLTGILQSIIRAIMIPIAINHLYVPDNNLNKNGATRYRTSIIDTNHAPLWNSQYSNVHKQRRLSPKVYLPNKIKIRQYGR